MIMGAGWSLAEDARRSGAPDQDEDAVQAERGGGGRAEGRGGQGRGDREVAHRRGEQQGGGGRPGGAVSEQVPGECRTEEEDREGGRHHRVARRQVNLGGDEGDQRGDGEQGGKRGGSRRGGGGERPRGDWHPAAERYPRGQRQRDHEGEAGDDPAGREPGVAGVQRQDRTRDRDRRDGGADQRAGGDGGLAAGHRRGRDRGDLARRQAHHENAVPQRPGGHHQGHRPGQRGQHGNTDG